MSEISKAQYALNLWTISAIAIVAYCLAIILHEALGHGGACLLVGGQPKTLNATSFLCDMSSVSSFGRRLVNAAGSIINLITGVIALAIVHFGKFRSESFRYFLWLFAAVSLLSAFGYLLFSGVTGVGDWVAVVRDLIPNTLSRILLALIGAVLYFRLAPKLLMPSFKLFLNEHIAPKLQIQRLLRLPYVVGGTTVLIAGLENIHASNIVFISAAASAFGATSLLGWYPQAKIVASSNLVQKLPQIRHPSKGWLIAGAASLLIFVGIIGQGVNL